MAEAKFSYEGQDIVLSCDKNQKMKDICANLSNKINVDTNSLVFLCQLNLEKTFEDITKDNRINIIAYKKEKEETLLKYGRALKDETINEIISSNDKINSSLNGIISLIEFIINDIKNKVIDTNDIISQLENINVVINNINEDITKNNNKLNINKINDNNIITYPNQLKYIY